MRTQNQFLLTKLAFSSVNVIVSLEKINKTDPVEWLAWLDQLNTFCF